MPQTADMPVETGFVARAPFRVAFVTETFPPELGGAALCAGRFVGALRERGHAVLLVRPRQGPLDLPRDEDGVEHLLVEGRAVPFHAGLQIGLPAPQRVRAAFAEWRPDVVHLLSEGPLGWSALWAARRLGLPVTSSFHTNFHAYAEHYGLGWLRGAGLRYLRAFHNRTRRTMVPTCQVRDELHAAGFRRLTVVSRGVDAAAFSPRHRREDLRARWSAAAGAPVALMVGRLAPEKNLALGERAYRAMCEARHSARLVVVGDGPARARLQAALPDAHFTGALRGPELAWHYASADVFLFPSRTETFGNVVLEAMASGLAVVAFDEGAAREHVRPQINGLLARKGDEREFVTQAVSLACDAQLSARLGHRARDSAERLSWQAVGTAFERELSAAVQPSVVAAPAPWPSTTYPGLTRG